MEDKKKKVAHAATFAHQYRLEEEREHRFRNGAAALSTMCLYPFGEALIVEWARHYTLDPGAIHTTCPMLIFSLILVPSAAMAMVNLGRDVLLEATVEEASRWTDWLHFCWPFMVCGQLALVVLKGTSFLCTKLRQEKSGDRGGQGDRSVYASLTTESGEAQLDECTDEMSLTERSDGRVKVVKGSELC